MAGARSLRQGVQAGSGQMLLWLRDKDAGPGTTLSRVERTFPGAWAVGRGGLDTRKDNGVSRSLAG